MLGLKKSKENSTFLLQIYLLMTEIFQEIAIEISHQSWNIIQYNLKEHTPFNIYFCAIIIIFLFESLVFQYWTTNSTTESIAKYNLDFFRHQKTKKLKPYYCRFHLSVDTWQKNMFWLGANMTWLLTKHLKFCIKGELKPKFNTFLYRSFKKSKTCKIKFRWLFVPVAFLFFETLV